MTNSESRSRELDLERDLPTTDQDIEALRRHRAEVPFDRLESLDRLNPPSWVSESPDRRKPFGDCPPFEL